MSATRGRVDEKLLVEDGSVERSNRRQSESWLTQALHRKRERGSSNRDIPEFVASDQPFVADTDALRFDDETTSFVSLKISVPPDRVPRSQQKSPAPQVRDATPADREGQDSDTKPVDETAPPMVSPQSPELGDRLVLSTLLSKLRIQFDERTQSLEDKIGELNRLVTEVRQDGKEQFGRLDATITAAVATLQEAAQEMQRSSALIVEKFSNQAQAQTEELHALRSARGSRKTFWNGFLIMTAAVGIISTLYFTVFAP